MFFVFVSNFKIKDLKSGIPLRHSRFRLNIEALRDPGVHLEVSVCDVVTSSGEVSYCSKLNYRLLAHCVVTLQRVKFSGFVLPGLPWQRDSTDSACSSKTRRAKIPSADCMQIKVHEYHVPFL